MAIRTGQAYRAAGITSSPIVRKNRRRKASGFRTESPFSILPLVVPTCRCQPFRAPAASGLEASPRIRSTTTSDRPAGGSMPGRLRFPDFEERIVARPANRRASAHDEQVRAFTLPLLAFDRCQPRRVGPLRLQARLTAHTGRQKKFHVRMGRDRGTVESQTPDRASGTANHTIRLLDVEAGRSSLARTISGIEVFTRTAAVPLPLSGLIPDS